MSPGLMVDISKLQSNGFQGVCVARLPEEDVLKSPCSRLENPVTTFSFMEALTSNLPMVVFDPTTAALEGLTGSGLKKAAELGNLFWVAEVSGVAAKIAEVEAMVLISSCVEVRRRWWRSGGSADDDETAMEVFPCRRACRRCKEAERRGRCLVCGGGRRGVDRRDAGRQFWGVAPERTALPSTGCAGASASAAATTGCLWPLLGSLLYVITSL
ncbi:unnamed protein product [Camellia sinensis]